MSAPGRLRVLQAFNFEDKPKAMNRGRFQQKDGH